MAATAIMTPTTTYSSGPPPPYQSWSDSSRAGLSSPPDSRRTSDNKPENSYTNSNPQTQKQSLPSIHEALSGDSRTNPYTSPISTSFPPSGISITHGTSTTTRPYQSHDHPYPTSQTHRPPSPPQPLHPPTSSFSRVEVSDVSRHSSTASLSSAHVPHNPYPATPRYESGRFENDQRQTERLPGYLPPPPPPPPPPSGSYSYGPAPHHIPPPPSQQAPNFTEPRYQPPGRHDRTPWEKQSKERKPEIFQQHLKRKLEGWDFENALSQVCCFW